jgi:hypothetical protein
MAPQAIMRLKQADIPERQILAFRLHFPTMRETTSFTSITVALLLTRDQQEIWFNG